MTTAAFSFIRALHTDAPAPDRADKMRLYCQFIGRWEMDAVLHGDDGTKQTGRGEIHFGWVLEGRAIQDVRPSGCRRNSSPAALRRRRVRHCGLPYRVEFSRHRIGARPR
jgi:hypothetical protein